MFRWYLKKKVSKKQITIIDSLGKLRNPLRFQWKALGVSGVPMEHIEFCGSHPIQLLLNHIYWQEVPCSVQKKSSMSIKRFITNSGSGNHHQTQSAFSTIESIRRNQLKERFQTMSCPKNSIRVDFYCYFTSYKLFAIWARLFCSK